MIEAEIEHTFEPLQKNLPNHYKTERSMLRAVFP